MQSCPATAAVGVIGQHLPLPEHLLDDGAASGRHHAWRRMGSTKRQPVRRQPVGAERTAEPFDRSPATAGWGKIVAGRFRKDRCVSGGYIGEPNSQGKSILHRGCSLLASAGEGRRDEKTSAGTPRSAPLRCSEAWVILSGDERGWNGGRTVPVWPTSPETSAAKPGRSDATGNALSGRADFCFRLGSGVDEQRSNANGGCTAPERPPSLCHPAAGSTRPRRLSSPLAPGARDRSRGEMFRRASHHSLGPHSYKKISNAR